MHKKVLMFLLIVVWATPAFAQAPTVVSTIPAQNELNVPLSANISVTFDVDMDETTINDSTFVVNSRCTGLHLGTITYDGPSKTATFDPSMDFDDGEVVTVVLTTGIESSGATPLDSAYVWSFTLTVYDGSGTFIPDSVYGVGSQPWSVFSADFDGDGDLDLATANYGPNNVSVLLNDGDGTFAPDSVYPVGDTPFSVFAADLDGDGDLDLATANVYSHDVSVLLNNGDGTFAPHSVYPVGNSPMSVFSADLDGDGDLDLATANQVPDNVSVLLNNGDGTFAPHSVYPVGSNPFSVFAADLDGDGDLDLAVANWFSHNVSVLLNDGDGTFAPHSVYPVGYYPYSVFSSDLDGDGDLDLAVANASDNVSVLLNYGDGTFAPHSDYPVGNYPYSVFSSDLDGDGDLDLAVANASSDNVSVLLNYGDGTFAPHSVYPVGAGPRSVFSADLDGDGDLDLAIANSGTNNVTVLLNQPPPHIVSTSPAQNELNVPVSTSISVTFDVDMDETTINDSTFVVNARSTGLHQGTITYDGPSRTATFDPLMDFDDGEVVTVVLTIGIQSSGGAPLDSSYAWSFTLVVNDGSGTFALDSIYAAGNAPFSVFAADLDGDGDLDLATADYLSDNVSVLLNYGDGTFAPDSVYPAGDGPFSVFAGDFDGDGDLDLATANSYSDNVSVLLNNGDGTFAPHSVYTAGDGPYSVFAADLDADGDLDLATANILSDNVSVLLNNGDGTFAPHSVYPVSDGSADVFAADLDGDGDLDLASANAYWDDVLVLLNNGDGTFAPHSFYPVGDFPYVIFAADLDEDGDVDLTTANQASDNVSVLLNNGDGTFAPHSVYPVGDGSFSVFAGDLDGDGDLDLATANQVSDNVSVLLNNGDGTFAPHTVYPVGDNPYFIFAADLDEDGDLDLAVANFGSGNVSVLSNLSYREVFVTPGHDTSGGARTDVAVKFCVQNTGELPDTYDVNVADSLGWTIDPVYYEVAVDTAQLDSVSFTISIPNVPLGTADRIFLTATSQADPSVLDSASLTVTCDAYNVDIADISDVGNDQGKQVHVDWSSFPSSDPVVTDFSIFRRKDSLLISAPDKSVIEWGLPLAYPPGEWQWLVTIPAFGESLYSAVVPTLKDSSIAEGMYWSVFFIRAGTDDPIVYFDSPVDSGYSLDNLSPSPPVGLLASHEPAVTKLTWGAIPDVDFDYFTVYRDTSSGFTPGPNSRLGYTIDSVFVDSTAELGRTYYYLASATDFSGNESDPSNEAMAVRYNAGDANGDGIINVGDVVYLVSYLYRNGPAPSPVEAGDCNCDDIVNVGDVVYLVSYLYRNGPPPAC